MMAVYIRQDESGHDYLIPVDRIKEYDKLSILIDSEPEHSPNWYVLIEEFIDSFSQYGVNGSINNIKFYVDEKSIS